MATLKTRLMTALAAGTLALSIPVVSQASFLDLDLDDIHFMIDHISTEVSQLAAMVCVKAENVKAVYVEDALNVGELADLDADLHKVDTQLEIITLRNTLNNMKVLNGSETTLLKDWLNQNNFDINDAIGLEVFRDGRVVILGCAESCE